MHPRVLRSWRWCIVRARGGTKRLGSMPDPPDYFDTYIPPKRRVLNSIYLSIDSITPRCIFLLNSSFAASIFIPRLLLLATPRCPSTSVHSPSHHATTPCPTNPRTLNNPPRLPVPLVVPLLGLVRQRPAAGHPKAPISSASLVRLRHTSKTQIA